VQESQKQTEEIERQRESLSHMAYQNLSLGHKIGELQDQNKRITELERKLEKISKHSDIFF